MCQVDTSLGHELQVDERVTSLGSLADRDLNGQFGVHLICLVARQMRRGGILGAPRWWGAGPDTHLK